MADIDCIVNENIELQVLFIRLLYDFKLLVELIGNLDIIGTGLWYDRETNGIYTIVFLTLLRILRTHFDPGYISKPYDACTVFT